MSQQSQHLAARLGGTVFPVRLFKATGDPKDVKFDRAGPHGRRLENHVVRAGSPGVAEKTELREEGYPNAPLEGAELKMGLWSGDTFVDLTEHLKRIDEEETLEEMEVLDFVRREAIPLDRVLGSYWLAPGDHQGAKVIRLIHHACRKQHRAAVVTWTKNRNRAEGLAVAHPSGAMLIVEVSFAENAREIPAAALSPNLVEVTEDETDAIERLVAAMHTGPETLDEVVDDRRARRRELHEYVEANGKAPALPEIVDAEVALEEADAFDALMAAASAS